jgi:hypothetical protein
MISNSSKAKPKRPPKGQRTHVRRLKQAAREEGSIYRPPVIHRAPAKKAGE